MPPEGAKEAERFPSFSRLNLTFNRFRSGHPLPHRFFFSKFSAISSAGYVTISAKVG